MKQPVILVLVLLLIISSACNAPAQPASEPTVTTDPGVGATVPHTTDTPPVGAKVPPATRLPATATTQPDQMTEPDQPIGAVSPVNVAFPSSVKDSSSERFAMYKSPRIQTTAQIQAPAIAPDLSNVALSVLLSPAQRERIAQNGFVVSPGEAREFYEIYERARYDYVPIFVTSDSLLHVYHLLFDKTLRVAETEFFIPMLTQLDWEMLRASAEQHEALAGTAWAPAARRNAAYFAVAVKLLNPDWPVPEGLRDLVDPDLARIASHEGIGPSAIFPAYEQGEDWSQYVPRGHYTQSAALERYFRAMMWHGRMTFRATDVTETRQAALLTLAFQQTRVDDQPAEVVWSGIYEPTVFFVGRSDDLTPQEYGIALEQAYGSVSSVQDLLNAERFERFQAAIKELRPPEILGMVVSQKTPDVEAATQGLRFMGQRFVPDAFVFRQLIARNVPERTLPKSLDFFAALGSERALQHLEASGDTQMTNYQRNMNTLRTTFASYEEEVWTQNLYWAWIHSLRLLLEPVDAGYPEFMRSAAWQDKQLQTALGSWTELKRDTILYAKQVYAEGSGGGPPPPVPPKGYVEPVPQLYARIAALSQMTIDGLDSRGLLNEQDRFALERMVDIAQRLQTMAEKQLRNEALSEEEYEFIRGYGRQLESLTFDAADDEGGTVDEAAIVADIATDPAGAVLQVGTGRIFEIYVVAPVEGQLVLTKGGVYAHYEFVQPLGERLTDAAWRERLSAGNVPPLAEWTSSFIVEQRVEQPLAETITEFNNKLANALWFTDIGYVERFLAGQELADTRAYIDQLKAEKQFVSARRLSLAFLAFDFQDEQSATVTTRERWTDERYRGSPYDVDEPVLIGTRPPYETTVTYTMRRMGDAWKIINIELQPEMPPWQ